LQDKEEDKVSALKEEDKVSALKEEVRLQYQKMQQLLEEDLGKTLEVLDKARSKFCQENSSQSLQLDGKRQEAKKLLSSVQTVFDKADDINFMKNTKPVKILMDRTQSCIGNSLAPHKVGHLNSKIFLSEISKKEKSLRKMLEAPFAAPAHFLQCVYPCSSGSEKRKHSSAFPSESSSSGATGAGFLAPDSSSSSSGSSSSSSSSSGPLAKQQFLVQSPGGGGGGGGEGQSSQQPPPPMPGPCGSAVAAAAAAAAAAAQHSASVFPPPPHPYPPGPGSSSQQPPLLPQYGGRKILMCTMDNCYCSGVPSVSRHRAHPPYPRSGSFPWAVGSQEYPPHAHALGPPSGPPPPPPMSQPLQGLSMRDWMDASAQTHRHPDFYSLYGQASAKHYVTS
ncbi:E3 ubiquitin-protein ligase TRIM8-like, partial [Engraulis encrasicolus]|uniref:E3 ubiquitin-protein ligase TRIM8-like n=1 Tax=Engraulis encrasicolus TaxID=184585 RepID=UPI002FD0EF0E